VISPRAADRIRKVAGYALATVLTVLLFRVLARLAHGRLRAVDAELWALLGLAALAVAWVRAAKRVRRAQPQAPPDDRPPDGPRGAP
jgi:hypothetical protein